MGGIPVVVSGDNRQILPILKGGTKYNEITSTLMYSKLWPEIRQLKLTKNTRIAKGTCNEDEEAFSNLLLDIGDGRIPSCSEKENKYLIEVPKNCGTLVNDVEELIDKTFPNITHHYKSLEWITKRAILATANEKVDEINYRLMDKITEEEEVTYYSIDSTENPGDLVHCPIESLNSLRFPGFPPHELRLKTNMPIILLRNVDPESRLFNGTRLQIRKLKKTS